VDPTQVPLPAHEILKLLIGTSVFIEEGEREKTQRQKRRPWEEADIG
jgi:hypothetical protein